MSKPKSNRINLHIYQSAFEHESRILKETKSIAEANLIDQIHIIATWKEGLLEHEQLDAKRQVWRVRVKVGGQRRGLIWSLLRFIEWQMKIILKFAMRPITIVNCHSVMLLPLGVILKFLSCAYLIYDTHELETESASARGHKKKITKLIEKSSVYFVDSIITVNDSISCWYRNEYHLDHVYTVRNVPVHLSHIEYNLSGFSLLKERLGIPQDDLLYIYLGGLFDFRGIEIMLKVFAKMDPRKHIVFMGYGEWQSIIETFAKANSNIHFHKAVKPDEVCIYASQADVGIHVPENICLSYYFSLPNKVFEYILSGLPIVVSDFPEMRRLINEGQCGWAIEPTEEALYSVIISISSSDILVRKQNVLQYRKELKWQNEEKVLIDAYHNLVK